MATKLDKPVTREVVVKDNCGCEGSVHVTLNTNGVSVRGKGTQRDLTINWSQLASAAESPEKMPSKYNENKLGWLVEKKTSKS